MGFRQVITSEWTDPDSFMFQGLTDDATPVIATYAFVRGKGWVAWDPHREIEEQEVPPEVLGEFRKGLN
jgi:hypothetical protein